MCEGYRQEGMLALFIRGGKKESCLYRRTSFYEPMRFLHTSYFFIPLSIPLNLPYCGKKYYLGIQDTISYCRLHDLNRIIYFQACSLFCFGDHFDRTVSRNRGRLPNVRQRCCLSIFTWEKDSSKDVVTCSWYCPKIVNICCCRKYTREVIS